MTIQEIVTELEGLKDYTNDHGKGVLEVLKREVQKLVPAPVIPEPVVEAPKPVEKVKPKAVEVVKPAPVKAEKAPVKSKWFKKKK